MYWIEALKVIFLGIVEGITEWLPISSTGHMLLVDEFLRLNLSEAFKEMFFVVIQVGAIIAVVLLFWKKMWPFGLEKDYAGRGRVISKKQTWVTWLKVLVACLPGMVMALLFDDYIDEHLHTPLVIIAMLILYGIAFIIVETLNRRRRPTMNTLADITYPMALLIGLFQMLSIIPGTSRSGAIIVGALLLGVSRKAAAEFAFFLAVPAMLGWSLLKIVKLGLSFSAGEFGLLFLGMAVAFIVSLFVIRFLMNYIRRHDFRIFGWYRILLGVGLGIYFLLAR